jgi:hypothetical protein
MELGLGTVNDSVLPSNIVVTNHPEHDPLDLEQPHRNKWGGNNLIVREFCFAISDPTP